jgi:hypothetical protein
MQKPKLSLEPSEGIVVQAAANIYAAYISAGKVPAGKEKDFIVKSIQEATTLAQMTDKYIQSDYEMG